MIKTKTLPAGLLLLFFISLVVKSWWDLSHLQRVTAAASWVQTDWSGGSGQTAWSNSSQFSSSTSINHTTAGQLTLPSSAASGWYNNSWTQRKQITFDATKVSGGTNLSDFPVLINLTSDASLASLAQSSGNDILFTASDGTTKLSHEIEKYTNSTGELVAWVKIPTLSASSNTQIYLYYGNTGAADQQDRQNVWSNGYIAVWHLKENPSASAPQFLDSAGSNHGTAQFILAGSNITGQIDGALSLPDVSDHVSIGDPVALRLTSNMTVTAWANATSFANSGRIISKLGFSGQRGFSLNFDNTLNKASFSIANTSNSLQQVDTATTPPTGSWIYLAGTYEPSTALHIYLNGALSNSNTTSISTTQHSNNSQEIRIGNRPVYQGDYNGKVDEVRIANVTRSAGWIGTEFNNQNSPSTFYSLAAAQAQTAYATSGSLTSSIFDTTTGGEWGILSYTATTPTSTGIAVKARSSNASDMSGATDFASCSAISSGADISSNNCIADGHRYIQYQVTLTTSDTAATPTFSDITINYNNSNQAPTVSLSSPGSYVTSTTPTFSGTASDADGTIATVEYQMNGTGGAWSSCSASDGAFDEASEAFVCTVSTALNQGNNTLYVRATDAGSSTATPVSASFAVDSISPIISAVLATPTSNSVSLQWSTDEASSTFAVYGVGAQTQTTPESDTSPRVTSHSLTIPDLVACTYYTVQLSSRDVAGNVGTAAATFTTAGCPASATVLSHTTAEIDTAVGGNFTLSSATNPVSISVPAGYFAQDLTFQAKEIDPLSVATQAGVPTGYLQIPNHTYYLSAYSDPETKQETFLAPLTITMTYSGTDVSSVDENTLRMFSWDGNDWEQLSNCVVNLSSNSISCTTTHFSVFSLFGQAAQATSATTSNTSSASSEPTPPTCQAPKPGNKAPWLYAAVPIGPRQIHLYFASAEAPLDHYALEFGTKSGSYTYGLTRWGNATSRTIVVNDLQPRTTYFFRVRAGNDCAPGPWSNELKATTLTQNPFASSMYISQSEVEVDTTPAEIEPDILPELEVVLTPSPSPIVVSPSPNPSPTLAPTMTQGTKLTINVKDANQQPVADAEVEIHSVVQRGRTDENGQIVFASVEPGNHTISVRYQGFTGQQSLDVKEGSGDVTVHLQVELRPGRLAQLSLIATPVLGIALLILVILFILRQRKTAVASLR